MQCCQDTRCNVVKTVSSRLRTPSLVGALGARCTPRHEPNFANGAYDEKQKNKHATFYHYATPLLTK